MADNSLSATVTHEQAREAHKKLHDHVYCGGRIPTLSVPPQPTDVDIVLCNYIEQQAALSVESGEGTPQPDRNSVLEEAAQIADYHHANHCENHDGDYRNCGMAIATGIRDLKSKSAARESTAPRKDTATAPSRKGEKKS